MLFSPVNFTWAREFLASNASSFLDDHSGLIDFSIPNKCPSNEKSPCLTEITGEQLAKEEGQIAEGQIVEDEEKRRPKASKATPKRRGCHNPPLSDKEVRRSERFKNKNNGFKSSICSDRRCISCCPTPPILSTKLIKNLGTQFCKMDPADLSDEALLKKKRKMAPIGQGMSMEGQDKEAVDEENRSPRVREDLGDEEELEG